MKDLHTPSDCKDLRIRNFGFVIIAIIPSSSFSTSTPTNLHLKGEYEDYTWGYHRNPLDYPLPSVPDHQTIRVRI